MSEIQETIITRVKKKLQINDDLDAFTLFKLLIDARKNSHPDIYDDDLKEKAQEKFQELTALILEFRSYLESTRLEQTPQTITLFEKDFELSAEKFKITKLEDENNSLQTSIRIKDSEIKSLKEEVHKLQEVRSDEATLKLQELYKPRDSNFIVLGISAFLLLSVNILSQVQSLKKGLIEIIPFGIQYLNYILFTLLIFVVIKLILNNSKYQKVQGIAEELKSSSAISDFYFQYKKEEKGSYYNREFFTETDVEKFITYRFMRRRYLPSLAYRIENLFVISGKKSLNYLRDIFIYNLIVKEFIRIGETKSMDRKFWIK